MNIGKIAGGRGVVNAASVAGTFREVVVMLRALANGQGLVGIARRKMEVCACRVGGTAFPENVATLATLSCEDFDQIYIVNFLRLKSIHSSPYLGDMACRRPL